MNTNVKQVPCKKNIQYVQIHIFTDEFVVMLPGKILGEHLHIAENVKYMYLAR